MPQAFSGIRKSFGYDDAFEMLTANADPVDEGLSSRSRFWLG